MFRHIIPVIIFGVFLIGRAETFFPSFATSSPEIATVYWTNGSDVVSLPVISLDNIAPLTLHFDILDNEYSGRNTTPWLRASIEHRDAEWQAERIHQSQYVSGFNVADIGFGEPSAGGLTNLYTHYEFMFPNNNIIPKISGNYFLNIYEDANPDSILLRVPFMVEENSVRIRGSVSPVTDFDYMDAHQQLELTVDIQDLDPSIMPSDIRILIGQNRTPGLWRFIGYPSSINGPLLNYSHKPSLIFEAGNEFRRMEIVSNSIPMMNVDHIEWHDPYYHHILKTDHPRNSEKYIPDFSTHGSFIIKASDAIDSDIEADYAVTHFFLDGSQLAPGSEIYLHGDFIPSYPALNGLMEWDSDNNIYYKSILLKQGAYSYQYITPTSNTLYNVDGNFFQTFNIYDVGVYYRLPGEQFDRLASFNHIYSAH